ncbi:uncharacterized protein DNG_03017 [Cephalotrichum gorgonifer]|uniref:Uncharacterized protein n=1 Tax=Cephalotrichum gorgonifer TaxID=2041049 RepID=A0AAE8STU3_9PEZI|nr:uncharacterized protein DNG_03017 [Cephalotrichum gorgonifer]
MKTVPTTQCSPVEGTAETFNKLSFENTIKHLDLQAPVDAFSVTEFRARHGGGATVELRNEELRIRAFNDARTSFSAWVLGPLSEPKPLHGGRREWLILVNPPAQGTDFPKLGESCELYIDKMAVVGGKHVATGFMPATRVDNPFESSTPAYSELVAFKVLPPAGKRLAEVVSKILAQFAAVESHSTLEPGSLHADNSVNIILRIGLILTSYLAEMSALNFLSEPKRNKDREAQPHSLEAFTWMLDFSQEPPSSINLFELLPHMRDPLRGTLPQKLIEMFKDLNEDHLGAYYGLESVPARLHMVSGCPGAGKTHWNLLVAAIAMAKTIPGNTTDHRVRVLYMIDVNKPVDDVADRMYRLVKAAGLKRKVIRMYGWPYELRQSKYIDGSAQKGLDAANSSSGEELHPDFTLQFISTARNQEVLSQTKAPTLDQAAWEHFRQHEDGEYVSLAKSLGKLLEGGAQTPGEAKSLRSCVYRLYQDVLKEVDFIATTPVSAYGNFPQMFPADIVFLDEAPHARELTSLIPIAFFSPIVWIFTGDFRQTKPFVASSGSPARKDEVLLSNPFCQQLTVSMMERADRAGALRHALQINHRCYGNLERLASKLFYGSKMRSGIPLDKRLPPTLTHIVHAYLERMTGRDCAEPRVLVHIVGAQEAVDARSYSNEKHQAWVMARVKELVADEKFRRVDSVEEPGTIMIIAPYRAAIAHYKLLVRHLDQSVQSRVDIRTVDTAQGHQADVVFLDLVRTRSPGFMDDAHRLCVAITRARQAEFIVMNPRMLRRKVDGRLRDTSFLMKMWRDVFDRGQYVKIG